LSSIIIITNLLYFSSLSSSIQNHSQQANTINMHLLTPAIAAAILAASVTAHPGHDHAAEMAERAAFTKFSKRDLSHCAEKIKARGIEQRAIARRAATAKSMREKRGMVGGMYYSHCPYQLSNKKLIHKQMQLSCAHVQAVHPLTQTMNLLQATMPTLMSLSSSRQTLLVSSHQR
jgi:hypothetical protein